MKEQSLPGMPEPACFGQLDLYVEGARFDNCALCGKPRADHAFEDEEAGDD